MSRSFVDGYFGLLEGDIGMSHDYPDLCDSENKMFAPATPPSQFLHDHFVFPRRNQDIDDLNADPNIAHLCVTNILISSALRKLC
jgi:hypothetical protein